MSSRVRYFDREATTFSARYDEDDAFRERFAVWDQALQNLTPALQPDSLVIDAGCGAGRLADIVTAQGFRYFGIDESRQMLSLAERRADETVYSSRITFHQAELTTFLPELAGAANLILCSSVLEYADAPEQLVRTLVRYLDDRGLFLVSLPNPRSRYRKIERILKYLPILRPSYLRWQKWTPSFDDAIDMFRRCGLDCLSVRYFGAVSRTALFGTPPTPAGSTLILLLLRRTADTGG